MRTKEISRFGTVFVFIFAVLIGISIAMAASVMLGLSLVETILSSIMVILFMLVVHLVFMLSYNPARDGEASLDRKVNYIAAEVSALRKQQAHMRQHFDHELKYMHGLSRSTDDKIDKMNQQIEASLAKLIEEAKNISALYARPNIAAIRENQTKLFSDDSGGRLEDGLELDDDVKDDDALIELLNQSLADNNVDLYAQPIVTLPA
ncbi:MAG: hypothetical protein HRU28_09080, partial [Rhizobiales bacterium]|nr:hypothetical protein [Hyphomicrobiales bacterium]